VGVGGGKGVSVGGREGIGVAIIGGKEPILFIVSFIVVKIKTKTANAMARSIIISTAVIILSNKLLSDSFMDVTSSDISKPCFFAHRISLFNRSGSSFAKTINLSTKILWLFVFPFFKER
jgi:hypothetical protein